MDRFHATYGWMDVVDTLANGDSSKWGYYFSLTVLEVFNRLAFYKAKSTWQAQQSQKRLGSTVA